jgi:type IV pilus assembly protein PilC
LQLKNYEALRVTTKALFIDATEFISELALLLGSEMSCAEALETIAQAQENFTIRSLVNTIHTDVKQGITLADSLAKYPQYFEPFLVDIVRSGEQKNSLAETLTDIAEYREKLTTSAGDLTNRLMLAFIYPVTLLFIVLLFLFFMFTLVVPTFTDLFASFGGELPALTARIIYLSEVVTVYWWLIIAILLLLGGLLIYAYQQNTLLSKVPFMRRFFHKIALIRFLYTYAFALAHHLSPAHALAACAQATDNKIYANLFERMRIEIEAGTLLTEVFLKQTLFPEKVRHLIAVSAKAKRADKLFSKLADKYTRQLQRAIEPTLRILSIVMTLIIGCIIALLVIAMYLPIFKMGEVI